MIWNDPMLMKPAPKEEPVGDLAVGKSVWIQESGQWVEFLVVHQGIPDASFYDTSCDGTWVLRKDIHSESKWDAGESNNYENSDIKAWLNGDYFSTLGKAAQNAIETVKIPYRSGGGSGGKDQSGTSGLSCKIFLLSGYEVAWDTSTNKYFPQDGKVLKFFSGLATTSAKRIAYLDEKAISWWLRSPSKYNSNLVLQVNSSGNWYNYNAGYSYGVRPAFIIPKTALFDPNTNRFLRAA